MTDIIIGWDIGGAHVKFAHLYEGVVTRVTQIPCPAIQDRAKFARAIQAAMADVPHGARHAVTMTGELSDVFASRAEGVAYLIESFQQELASSPRLSRPSTTSYSATQDVDARHKAGHDDRWARVAFYAGPAGFVPPEDAPARWSDIASANWHATAALLGRLCGDALLIDIGTTTTDIVPVSGGVCAAQGFTDAERLATRELVYTGVVRTPVMAVARRAPFTGRMQGLAAERFATMADVYRLTGDLPEGADDHPTPDGAGKSLAESAARLARMTGRDYADAPMDAWVALAVWLAERQMEEIAAVREVLEPHPLTPTPGSSPGQALSPLGRGSPAVRAAMAAIPIEKDGASCVPSPHRGEVGARQRATGEGVPPIAIVGAGCGRFLARRIAAQLGRPYTEFCELIDVTDDAREMAAVCAPAIAVALLLNYPAA